MSIEPGTRFGRLVVIGPGKKHGERTTSVCRCDCGTVCTKVNHNLNRGDTNSCGCLFKEKLSLRSTKHGYAGTRLYRIWKSMMTRATNLRRPQSKDYVLRGIGICSSWKNPIEFMTWAKSHGYTDDLTIDRIDNDKGYSPENCRWITIQEQQSNRRTNHPIEVNGVKYRTLKEAASDLGIPYRVLQGRLHIGWTIEEILKDTTKGKTK